MKSALLLAGAMLVLTSSLAFAAGSINIGWDDCAGPGPGATNRTMSCTSNAGVLHLAGSFAPPADLPQFIGHTGVVDIEGPNATLSPWWRVDPAGTCRAGALTCTFDFTSGPFFCMDPWEAIAVGGTDVALIAADRLRVRTACMLPRVFPLAADGHEYYLFRLRLNMRGAFAGICPGCTVAACIVFNELVLTQLGGVGEYTITTGPEQYATWQGGAVAGGCPAATPVRGGTWGTLKALYR